MLKIMICEDEAIDREALHVLIGRHFPDLVQLDDCVDGSTALACVPTEAPDILILDINMPGVDGIEVVRRLRQSGYHGKIMIHTAYDRFTYAQDALNYGADAFLLKPVKHVQFIATLEAFIAELRSAQDKPDEADVFSLYDYMVPQYLSGQVTDPALRRTVREYLNQRLRSAALVTFSISPETWMTLRLSDRAAQRKWKSVGNALRGAVEGDDFSVFENEQTGRWTAYFGSREALGEEELGLRLAHRTLLALLNVLETEGVYLQCAMVLLPNGFRNGDEAVLAHNEKPVSRSVDQILSDCPSIRDGILSVQQACMRLERGLPGATLWREWQAEQSARSSGLSDALKRFSWAAALLLSLNRALQSSNGMLLDEGLSGIFPGKLGTQETDRWVIAGVDALEEKYFGRDRRLSELTVKRACAYIHENYQRDISLSETAEYAGVSISHLSHQFRDKLGTSFIDYLQNVRMQKLMELLRQRDYSIRELAELLGFNNHTYFCQVVRQRTGKTVNQLKREIRGGRSG